MDSKWSAWIGKPARALDVAGAPAVARFAAMLDAEPPRGDSVPQGFHWCLCLPDAPTAEIDVDGHPKRGAFLPPIELPRRMWVGSDVEFVAPLPIGAAIERASTVASVAEKDGGSGRLAFVEIDHVTSADGNVVVRERQTIVYREAAPATATATTPATTGASSPPPAAEAGPDLSGWTWHRDVTPSEVLLFRYSALTFNSHRIHYDLPYVTAVEGYPGLVVQGPLTASLLLDLCARQLGPDALAGFAFRARSPAFAGQPLHLVGRRDGSEVMLAALGHDGRTIITATAKTRS